MTVIRKRYEDQLSDLFKDVRRLGLNVYDMIQQSIKVLSDKDVTHARQVIRRDEDLSLIHI